MTSKVLIDLKKDHPWATVVLDGRDLLLKGTAPLANDVDEAVKIAEEAYDVRIVSHDTDVLPFASPYGVTIQRADGSLTLKGNIPDENTRTELLKAAEKAADGSAIVDQLTLAGGKPEGFADLADFAVKQIAGLEPSSVTLSDKQLSIEGIAKTSRDYEAALRRIKGKVPADGEITKVDIAPPTASPYDWRAEFDGEAIVLEGNAPSTDARTEIEEALKQQMPDVRIRNRMMIADGEPSGFTGAAKYAGEFFPLFNQGWVKFSDNKFSVAGVSKGFTAFNEATKKLQSIPEGFELLENTIQPLGVSPYTWNTKLASNSVALSGYVPGQDVQGEMLKTVGSKFPGFQIEDAMEIAGGATANFNAANEYAIDVLSHFSSGAASLKDDELTISGVASSAEDYDLALSKLANVPDGIRVSADVSPMSVSPYIWSASKRDNGATLNGFVQSKEDKALALEIAQANLGSTGLTEDLNIASGAPANSAQARSVALQFLARLDSGKVEMVDNQVSLSGQLPDQATIDALSVEFEGALPSNFEGNVNLLVQKADVETEAALPIANPYRWSVSKIESGVTILGNAPGENERGTINSMVKSILGVAELDDRTILAKGAPDDLSKVQEVLTKQVKFLEGGQGNLNGNKVSITGRAKNKNLANLIERGLTKGVPEGFEVSTNITFPKTEIIKPGDASALPEANPYRLNIAKRDNSVTVRGNAPDTATQESIVSKLKSLFPGASITDKLSLAKGQLTEFATAAEYLASQLSNVEAGQVNMVGNAISLAGRVADEGVAKSVDTQFVSNAPEGYTASTNLLFPKPEQPETPLTEAELCQQSVLNAVDGRKILFDTNRATLKSESRPLLVDVTSAASKCPTVSFEIAGHTDSQGRDQYNQELSQARADAVLEFLVSSGITRSRLKAKGFGETNPIADNETAEGRSENRRIEFNVIQ
ncbi:MAG: OmpA family protein [Pseudomonadota bacterium]